MDTCIGMNESLCSSPETITTLLIGYTPIQNKKLKNIYIYIYTHICQFQGYRQRRNRLQHWNERKGRLLIKLVFPWIVLWLGTYQSSLVSEKTIRNVMKVNIFLRAYYVPGAVLTFLHISRHLNLMKWKPCSLVLQDEGKES